MPDAELIIEQEVTQLVVESPVVQLVMGAFQGLPGPAGGSQTFYAGAALSGHRAVRVAGDGRIMYADSAALSTAATCLGVIRGAVAEGAEANLALPGAQVTEPSWSWTPDQPVYLGASGVLTQTAPLAPAHLVVVGWALSATSLLVRIQSPITLA